MRRSEPVNNTNYPTNDVVGGASTGDIFDLLESVDCDGEFDVDWNPGEAELLGPIPSNMLSELCFLPPTLRSTAEESSAAKSQIPVSHEVDNSESYKRNSFLKITETPIPSRARSKLARQPSGRWHSFNTLPPSAKEAHPIRSKRIANRSRLSVIVAASEDTSEEKASMVSSTQNTLKGSKSCSHCGVTETPQWRFGPCGEKTLCNACGLRYKKDGLFPEYLPASSPSFDEKIHSNSHRKVIQMRQEKNTEMKGDKENLNS